MKEVHIKQANNGYIVEYDEDDRIEIYGSIITALREVKAYLRDGY